MQKYEYKEKYLAPGKMGEALHINVDYLDEAMEFVKKHKCSFIYITQDLDKKYEKSPKFDNFDFLYGCEFIEHFECLIPIKKKGDISGLYSLKDLKNLRCSPLPFLNLEKFSKLRRLNTIYYSTMTGWDKLENIDYIQLSGTDKETDLGFLSQCKLRELRIINGSMASINGLETCPNISKIWLQGCRKLSSVKSTIEKMANKPFLLIEGCGKIDVKTEIEPLQLKKCGVEYGGRWIHLSSDLK